MSSLCRDVLGCSRQNLYARLKGERDRVWKDFRAVCAVSALRIAVRQRWGAAKTHRWLKDRGLVAIGRDRLAAAMDQAGMLLRRRRRGVPKGPLGAPENLLQGPGPKEPGLAWAADTTYLRTATGKAALGLVVDLGSRYILSWHLAKAGGTARQALAGALDIFPPPAIHHSDRGVEFINTSYQSMLEASGIARSVSDKGKPHQNARIERINGILKHEMGLKKKFNSFKELEDAVEQAVDDYNNLRPHHSLGMRTPAQTLFVSEYMAPERPVYCQL